MDAYRRGPPTPPPLHFRNHQQNTAQAQPSEQPQARIATMVGEGVEKSQETSPAWQHFSEFEPPAGKKTSRLSARCGHSRVTCLGTAPCAQPAVWEALHVQPRRPCSGKEKLRDKRSFEPSERVPHPRFQGGDRGQPSIDIHRKEACPPVPSSVFLCYRPDSSRKNSHCASPSRPVTS